MTKVLRPLLLVLTGLTLWSCAPSLPSGILDEQEMEDVLVDIHLAQGMAETEGQTADVARYKYIQSVFRKHDITEAEFDSSMVYYCQYSEKMQHIYTKVVDRIKTEAERMGIEAATAADRFANLTADGDTANIWIGKDFTCLMADKAMNIWSFQMQADSTYRPGDSFLWRFQSQFVERGMNNEAIAQLNLYYEGDTVATVTELVRSSMPNELRYTPVSETDTLALRSITGFIYMPLVRSGDKPKPLLISGISFIRMHKEVLPEPEEAVAEGDSLTTDTLTADTILPAQPQDATRRTPLKMRDNQPRKRLINITKENPNPIHPERGIPQRANRNGKTRR